MNPDSARLAIAAHLHVLLRRRCGRVTDPEWMAGNWDYACEVVRLCRSRGDEADLQSWADRLEQAMQPLRPRPVPVPRPVAVAPAPAALEDTEDAGQRLVAQRYIGRLR